MTKELPIPAALQVISDLIKRTPMSSAEMVGAQCAVDRLEKLNSDYLAAITPKPAPESQPQ